MPKLVVWSPDEARQNLQQRLREARESRLRQERAWRLSERTIYSTQSNGRATDYNIGMESPPMLTGDAPDQGMGESVNINYTFKNLRFIHAQLSSNPPTVIPRPITNDMTDRRCADAADRLVRYGMSHYGIQDTVDRMTLNTLLYGTGIAKTVWDPMAGEILDINEETGELVMEGDFRMTIPNIWSIFFDADADVWDEVRYVFERLFIPYEEALYRWPEKVDILKQHRQNGSPARAGLEEQESAIANRKWDVIEVYEYWEKGLPSNGMLGRFCLCLNDGTLLTELQLNPERYAPPRKGNKATKKFEIGALPYHLLTDIDVPNRIYGKSFVEYNTPIQEMLNRIDGTVLETAQAHGIPRLILMEGSELKEDSITNSPWDVVKVTGTQPPHFMNPMPLPQIMPDLMARYRSGIDDMSGVNEAMFGQQSREQSGFSMQYATNQGNMIRYRLLNKYRKVVESIYRSYLRILQSRWDIPRTIQVLGKEKAFESTNIKGADLEGGYDIVADYGSSMSLDPTTRREEMLTYMPLFEKAGVSPRFMMKMLKLNEISETYDSLDLAEDRQSEIFQEMIATGRYIVPEELQDHKNMLDYAYNYLMTSEFKYLEEDSKVLIRQHVRAREQLAAQGPAPAAAAEAAPAPAGMPPIPGLTA